MLPWSRKLSQPLTRLLFAVGAVAIAGLWVAILLGDFRDAAPVDQTAGEGELRASTIQASFVGTARCAECHADKASDHATSGHSKTFHTVEDLSIPTQLHGQSYVDPIRSTTLEYQKEGDGLSVRIPEVSGKLSVLPVSLHERFYGIATVVGFTVLEDDHGWTKAWRYSGVTGTRAGSV
jgi:hypothetical protein